MKHFIINTFLIGLVFFGLSFLASFLFDWSLWITFGLSMIIPTTILAKFAYLTK